jgi:WD40 repeat protein
MDPNVATIDPAQIRPIATLALKRSVMVCRFDPAGKHLVTGDMGGAVIQWTVAEGGDWPSVALPTQRSWVAVIAFSPDGARLFTSDYSGRIAAWGFPAAEGATPVWERDAHRGWIRGLAVSPDGSLVASCGNDRAVRLWRSANGAPVRELAGHQEHVYSVVFHPSDGGLVSADLTGVVKHWDPPDGRLVRELDARAFFKVEVPLRLGGVRNMRFDAAGAALLCGGMTGISGIADGIGTATVLPFDWGTGEPRTAHLADQNQRGFVAGAFAHPAGFVLAATGGLDQGMLLFWKAGEPKPFHQFRLPQSAWSVDLHPDQRRVVTGDHSGQAIIYDLAPASTPPT